jgi:hypothetical protein
MVVSAGLKEAHIISGAGIKASAEYGAYRLFRLAPKRIQKLPVNPIDNCQIGVPIKKNADDFGVGRR